MNALLMPPKFTERRDHLGHARPLKRPKPLPLIRVLPGWVQVALFAWIAFSGPMAWHFGPDLNGVYGGLNGTGGCEAVYNQSSASTTCLLSDTYGHTEGTISNSTLTWNPTQCDGYGALPGTTAPSPITSGANVASQLGWRGHYIDSTGFYYLGARYYAPDSGNFLSPDPLGHAASMDLYSFCNGDPVNNFDPDGRCFEGVSSGLSGNISPNAPTSSAFYAGNLIGGALSGAGSGLQSGAASINQAQSDLENTIGIPQGSITAASFALGPEVGGALVGLKAIGAGAEVTEGLGAAEGGLGNAAYAQKTFSQSFSSEGAFSGQTISDVAGALKSGAMSPADVPIQYIVRDGNTLILNTRSAQALEQAGIPRGQWNAVNMTGDAAAEARLTGQLERNGLSSQGTQTVEPSGR